MVAASGSISFRYNYRINGRQETITLGRYGAGGLSMREARDALAEARKSVAAGGASAHEGREHPTPHGTGTVFCLG
nr:Arm DNA-binding domain-containing protein [Janthinobacterium sp. GW458P]